MNERAPSPDKHEQLSDRLIMLLEGVKHAYETLLVADQRVTSIQHQFGLPSRERYLIRFVDGDEYVPRTFDLIKYMPQYGSNRVGNIYSMSLKMPVFDIFNPETDPNDFTQKSSSDLFIELKYFNNGKKRFYINENGFWEYESSAEIIPDMHGRTNFYMIDSEQNTSHTFGNLEDLRMIEEALEVYLPTKITNRTE